LAHPVRKLRGKVAHSTKGRVRLRFRGATPAELQGIEAHVRKLPHVHSVEVHPSTGSVIAHHGPGRGEFASALADLGRHSALFYLDTVEDPTESSGQLTDVEHDVSYLADHSKSGKAILRYAEHLNRAVKKATDGWVDLRVLLPATAGVCALVFVEIESSPLWLPLALFSFQSFNNLHEPHTTTEGEAATHPLTPGAPASATTKERRRAPAEPSAKSAARPKAAANKSAVVRLQHGQSEGTSS